MLTLYILIAVGASVYVIDDLSCSFSFDSHSVDSDLGLSW